MKREPERTERLWHNTNKMRDGLLALGFDIGTSETPILPIQLGDMILCLQMSKRLQEEGVFVNPVVPPGVPPNASLIRLSLMATHTDSQIDFALEKLEKVAKELGVL